MRKVFLTLTLFAVFLCILPLSAHALMFSDLSWPALTGESYLKFEGSQTGLDYDINFLAVGGPLTWNPDDGGVGIGDDEITGGGEALFVWFSKPLQIKTFELVDLFYEGPADGRYQEGGFFAYDSDLIADGISMDGEGFFEAPLDQYFDGGYSVGVNAWVQGIKFFAGPNARNDFALAGYTTAVPEPSTVLLLGLGMIGLAGLGRRKFRKR